MPSSSTAKQQISIRERFARCALGFVLIAVFSFGFTSPVFAQTVTTSAKSDQQSFGSLPENQRLRIMIKMIKSGAHDQAEIYLQTFPLEGKHAINRTLFLEGMIAKAHRKFGKATKKFRAALANDPKLTMVRAELAHTLFITRQDDGAKHHMKLLSGAAPTPEAAKQFDQFIDIIKSRSPWKLSMHASIAPSTNFNKGAAGRGYIDSSGVPSWLDPYSEKKSGIGFTGGINSSYSFDYTDSLSLVVGAGANFVQYKGKAFDDTIISQNVSVVRKHKGGQITLGVSASQRFSTFSTFITTGTSPIDGSPLGYYDLDNEFIFEYGPHISVTQKLSNKTQVFAKLRYLKTDFKIGDYQNGSTITLDTRASHVIAQDLVLYGLAGGLRGKTKINYLDYWSGYFGVAFYKEFPMGITTYAQAKLTKKYYDGYHFIIGDRQKNTRFDFVASFTKRDFSYKGFAPRLDYIYSKSTSNSPFANYTNHGTALTVTRAF